MKRCVAILSAVFGFIGVILAGFFPAWAADSSGEAVQFNRDIRPFLSDTCFKCHGPDSAARKADLRLDKPEDAFAVRDGAAPIVPGDPKKSEAYLRMVSKDPEEMMPPPDSHLELTPQQKVLFRKWIEQGAKWEKHWSFNTIQKPALPRVRNTSWAKNPIDAFILARLEKEGLKPSPEAAKETLIRRVTFDLTGLPPTVAEVEAFVADASPQAYEKVVDRLLKSPRYGERMAMTWLDASRFADTNGYQVDTERSMWRWREWVINAFNQNMGFDRFTVEQLAGDMLPNATLQQRVASGFNRNHRINGEGGIIPEEFLVEYVADRVETTSTVWLGLTVGCARCHDHKYDPITQKEFYQLFAFFNNVPENGADGLTSPPVPFLKVPDAATERRLEQIGVEVAAVQKQLAEKEAQLIAGQAEWEKTQAANTVSVPTTEGLVAHYPMDGQLMVFKEGEAAYQPSPFGQSADFDGKRFIDAGDIGAFEFNVPFSFGAWVYTHSDSSGAVIARMDDANNYRGYNLFVSQGVVIVQIISAWPQNTAATSTAAVVKPGQWQHVFATYDGSGQSGGIKVYVDGEPVAANPSATTVTASIVNKVPLTLGTRTPGSRFKGRVDEVRLYSRALAPVEVKAMASQHLIASILATPADGRNEEQKKTLREFYIASASPPEFKQLKQKTDALTAERKQIEDALPTTLVMQELPAPKPSFVLMRGEYDKPGEKVVAAVPASFPALPPGAPSNRLGLAQWLISSENPLTARVAVNRFWQMHFGTGIVKSTEDFGSQAEWPSHPELLDWLADHFIQSGWDVKGLHKQVVMSATYRQASKVTPALLEKDPENRLLARGTRFRLPAEMVRDNVLAISGLLVEKLGGPSVRPYQPAKLWEELTTPGFSANTYAQQSGENLYRRSMYTFWKRTIPPPSMATFDAPSREICIVRRGRTNTPLQALALMNDVIYVEAARHLAQRMMKEAPADPRDRIAHGFRLATARKPTEQELKVLLGSLERRMAQFRQDPSGAEKLLAVGESPRDKNLNVSEHAAYTAVASLILNLDETITKE